MDISGFGIASVAVITVICYLIGMAVKATAIENKWIPIIVGLEREAPQLSSSKRKMSLDMISSSLVWPMGTVVISASSPARNS